MTLGNEIVAAQTQIGTPYASILARWPLELGSAEIRPAVVIKVFEITIFLGDVEAMRQTHFIAKVKWLKEEEKRNVFGFNSSLDVWCTDDDTHLRSF